MNAYIKMSSGGGGSIEPVSYKDASNPSHDEREGLQHFESQLNKTWIQHKNCDSPLHCRN